MDTTSASRGGPDVPGVVVREAYDLRDMLALSDVIEDRDIRYCRDPWGGIGVRCGADP